LSKRHGNRFARRRSSSHTASACTAAVSLGGGSGVLFGHRYERRFLEALPQAFQTTLAAIARIVEMQRSPAAGADELLRAYGSVDAVFSVGSSAIRERMGMTDEIPHVNGFVRELGKVLLALDDVEDIEEDLADGRLNYPARVLLEGEIASRTDISSLAKTWCLHARPEGYGEIRTALLDCLSRATDAIAHLELQPAMNLITTTKMAVQNLP
ncbi:MAG TPA: hypothetical protein VLT13_12525, partial [Bacteroidota bacterium]|nr:hypothetical protein [Bacteroidota bacterium]